jgi:hypothetical protein
MGPSAIMVRCGKKDHVARATAATDRFLIDDLAELYAFQDDGSVRGFLRQHPYLVPLLEEARRMIPRYFGHDVRVSLEVVENLESEDDQELYAKVHTAACDEALGTLRRFDEGWWLDALERAQGNLTITLRHV